MATAYFDMALRVTLTGAGNETRVEPTQATLSAVTEVTDQTVTIADSSSAVLWTTSDLPDDWEVAVIQLLTSGVEAGLELIGDAVTIGLGLSSKFPFIFPRRDAGAAGDALDGKVTSIEVHNASGAAMDVRIILLGPEA